MLKKLLSASVLGVSLLLSAAELVHSEGTWVLENGILRVRVRPDSGGRIVSFLDLRNGRDYTFDAIQQDSPGGAGLLADRLLPLRGPQERSFERAEYKVVESGKDGRGVFLTLRRTGTLEIEKTLRLDDGSETFRISYVLRNPGGKDFNGAFWSSNAVFPSGARKIRTLLPEGKYDSDMTPQLQKDGIPYDPEHPTGGNYYSRACAGTEAAAADETGGLRLRAPYEFLESFYSWAPGNAAQTVKVPTLEFFTEPFRLPPFAEGKRMAAFHPELKDPLMDCELRFEMSFTPFAGTFRQNAGRLPAKNERFRPQFRDSEVFRDFTGDAILFQPKPARKLRVLSLNAVMTSGEIWEFARRFGHEFRMVEMSTPAVPVDSSMIQHFSWVIPDPIETLSKRLEEKPDILLLSGLYESALPEPLRKKIRSLAENGMGIIYVGEFNRIPSLMSGPMKPVPEETLRGTAADSAGFSLSAVFSDLGKGRIVWVKSNIDSAQRGWTQNRALLPKETDGAAPSWREYAFAYFGKILPFAARRSPAGQIFSLRFEKGMLRSVTNSANGTVQYLLDGPSGRRTVPERVPPELFNRNGRYFFTAILNGTEGGEDCFTIPFDVRLKNGIDSLETARRSFRAGTAISGKAGIRGTGRLELRLCDALNRVLAMKIMENASGIRTFSLIPRNVPVSPLMTLEARLVQDEVMVDRKTMTAYLEPPSRAGKLNFILWGWLDYNHPASAAETLGFDVLTGFDVHNTEGKEMRERAERAMQAGMRMAPMGMHRIALWKIDSDVRKPCLRDPLWKQKMAHDVASTVEQCREFFPFVYFCGDENSLGCYSTPHDLCHSPFCMTAFRKELEWKYGSLKALNAVWGTSFARWEEVCAPHSDDLEGFHRHAWFEHRLFMMSAMTGAIHSMKQELFARDPGARLGFSGASMTDIHTGFDFTRILKDIEVPITYFKGSDAGADLLRCFSGKGVSGGAWTGYGAALPAIRYDFWSQIARGMFSPSYWCSNYFHRRKAGICVP